MKITTIFDDFDPSLRKCCSQKVVCRCINCCSTRSVYHSTGSTSVYNCKHRKQYVSCGESIFSIESDRLCAGKKKKIPRRYGRVK